MNKIEAFWDYFKEHQESYLNYLQDYENHPVESDEKVEKLVSELKQFSKGLSVSIRSAENPKELIITAQGKKEYFADAFEVVNNAPTIENWKFIATSPSYGLDFDFEITGVQISPNRLTFMPLDAPEYPHDIAIRVFHKDYTKEQTAQKTAVEVGASVALGMLFGEVDFALNFQYIDFDDMPHPKEQDFPLSQLEEYVEHKKSERPNAGQEFPKEDIALMEGKVDELPTLLVLNKSLKFYTFTKRYPYLLQMRLTLKNIGENGLPIGNTDELYLIEDIIYQEVYKKGKGHFIATETYNGKRDMFYYADSKETMDEALKLLSTEYWTCEVEYSVDYDPFWIGVEKYREL